MGKKKISNCSLHFPDLLAITVEVPQNGVCFQLLMRVHALFSSKKNYRILPDEFLEEMYILGKCAKCLNVFIYFVSLTELYSKYCI